jgi:hypothetical protein
MYFTEDEIAYMDYLDSLYDVPGGYGLLLRKGDPVAFELGLQEWLSEQPREAS